jgi:chromosome segregation ATPase
VCANRVVEKFTDLVSKNLGWGEAAEIESQTKPVMPLATVLQAVDVHLESVGDSRSTESGPGDPALRERCARIVSKISGVASLSNELTWLFEQYETIADAFESTRGALDETRGRLVEEGDAHAILKNRFAALERELVLEKSEAAALRAQIDHLAMTGNEFEQHAHVLQNDLQHARDLIEDAETQSAARTAEIAALSEELHTAKQDVLKAEIAAVALRAELSSALARASNFEAANSALQVALSDSRHDTEHLAESLDEARHELQRSQTRVHELEQQYEIQVGEHRQASAGMISQVEDQRAEMAALNIQVAVLSTRHEAADRLLKDVPVLMARAAAWEQKVAALEAENADMRAQAAEFEEVQQAVAERAHALVSAIKAKDKESSQTKASLVNLSTRLASETQRFAAERERAEEVIAGLRRELEAERARRSPQPADIAIANGVTVASAPATDNKEDSARTTEPLVPRQDAKPVPLAAEREHSEAIIADLRRQLEAERSRRSASQPAADAVANDGTMASAGAAGQTEDGAPVPEPLARGQNAKPAQLAAERQHLQATIADLRRELDAERSRRFGSQPADIAMAHGAAVATAAAAGNTDDGAKTPEGLSEADGAKPALQKFMVDEHQKPHPGGRKRRPRQRESNRHISRH